jgi:hypothetical protein
MEMTESRLSLYEKIMAEVRKFSLSDIKQSLIKRYRVDKFEKLSIEQLKDFLHFIKTVRTNGV